MAFSGLKSVEVIHLQNNLITLSGVVVLNDQFIPKSSPFQSLNQLKELNLSNNSIVTVFEDFTLSALAFLDLSHNKISKLSTQDLQAFSSEGLTIDLTYNQITEFDFQQHTDDQNMTVILENNPFVCDCHILHFVRFLTKRTEKRSNYNIHIGDLACTKPENLVGKKVNELNPRNLTCALDMEGTAIKMCPEDCKCMVRPDDRYLMIECGANVNLDHLPVASEKHLNRTELKIENNNLTMLPVRTSRGYKEITNLLVGGNDISEITVENIPPFIHTLELSNNKLSTLNQSAIDFLNNSSTLQELKLAGNPWNCNCENKKFMLFAQTKSKHVIADFHQMKCADGRSFDELNIGDLCSSINTFIIVISCITAVMGLVLGALAALYYKYQKQIKMWLYSHNMCLWFVTEEELDKVCESH